MARKKLIILLLALTALFLIGCSRSPQSNLSGTWERTTPAVQAGPFFGIADQIEFLKGGTFVIPTLDNVSGSFSFPEKDRIKFESQFGAAVYKFTLAGNTLTFDDNGVSVEYKKIK